MSNEQLAQGLLALPLSQRVDLAQALWQSINDGSAPDAADEERQAVAQARSRTTDLASGAAMGRSHNDVMGAARRVLECG